MKVVIDGMVIDTESIVKISPIIAAYRDHMGYRYAYWFTITLLGKNEIEIIRIFEYMTDFGSPPQKIAVQEKYYYFDGLSEDVKQKYFAEKDRVQQSVNKMRQSLMDLWSGHQEKYLDLTVE